MECKYYDDKKGKCRLEGNDNFICTFIDKTKCRDFKEYIPEFVCACDCGCNVEVNNRYEKCLNCHTYHR